MGKSEIVKSIYRILTVPFLLLSELLIRVGSSKFKNEYLVCEISIKENSGYEYDIPLYRSIVSAEDHRFNLHCGLDFYSIIRAIFRTCQRKTEGGSTIEQQFVRTVTLRYERTLLRKISEQLLAVRLSKEYCKIEILNSYISVAYYGHDYIGVEGVRLLYKKHSNLSPTSAGISIAARLKYPEPSIHSEVWKRKYEARRQYLQRKA